jgi:hypothetical protein
LSSAGNPEGIPVLEDPHAPLSHPELRYPRPLCFSKNQWHDWVTSSVEGYDGETSKDGYCYACLPEFKAQQCAIGACFHLPTGFEDEDGGTVGRRAVFWVSGYRESKRRPTNGS